MIPPADLRAWVEVDLRALTHNIELLKNYYGSAEIMAVVKADAYGHGVDLVAPAAYAAGVRHFGVATTDEGVYLRRLLRTDAVVYVLSPVSPADAPAIVDNRLIPVISSVEMAKALSKTALTSSPSPEPARSSLGRGESRARSTVHVDVDTGMGRSGFPLSEARAAVERIAALPGVEIAGVFTHFASADEDADDARAQHRLFLDFLDGLTTSPPSPLLQKGETRSSTLTVHASNSPASLVLGRTGFHSLIRPGLLLYGIEPAPGMLDGLDIKPVLSIRARVTLCRELPPGSTISYGKTYTVPSTGGRYATVAIGYGDGLPRPLGNVGSVIVHGRPAQIRGRVCMDQIVVDVTDIDGVRAGDVATVVGVDGESRIRIGDVAHLIRTTPHLISTCLLPRLPRIPT